MTIAITSRPCLVQNCVDFNTTESKSYVVLKKYFRKYPHAWKSKVIRFLQVCKIEEL